MKKACLILLFSIGVSFAVSEENLKKSVYKLSSFRSRIPGYPGSKEAADYILNSFKSIGLKDLNVQNFKITSVINKYSFAYFGDQKIKLYPLWPNYVRTTTLKKEGIKGKLFYVKTGKVAYFNGKDIEGNFVLMDFNCGSNWINAFRLGAKAVIFLEPEDSSRIEFEQKFLNIPLNAPRFLVDKTDGQKLLRLEGKEILLKSKVDWEEVETSNIYGFIEGETKDEIIVVEAYYDSISVVPELAYGAESACGVAGLLEIAKILKGEKLKRSVVILASSGHFFGRLGVTNFLNFVKESKLPVKLFVGLELSSQNDQLGIFGPGNFLPWQVNRLRFSHLRPFAEKFVKHSKNRIVDGIVPPGGKTWQNFIPFSICPDSDIALIYGITGLSFVTTQDFRYLVDTSLDKPQKVNFQNLSSQIKIIADTLIAVINDKKLFAAMATKLKDNSVSLKTQVVYFEPRKSFLPEEPIPKAVCFALYAWSKTNCGVRLEHPYLTDDEGYFLSYGGKGDRRRIDAYGLNDESEIIYAPDRGMQGEQNYPLNITLSKPKNKSIAVLFKCRPFEIYDLIDPQYLLQLTTLDIFDASDAVPVNFGYSFSSALTWIRSSITEGSITEPFAVAYVSPKTPIKITSGSGPLGRRILLINSQSYSSEVDAKGVGFMEEVSNQHFQAVKDMFNLNEWRINNLKKYGVENAYVESRHNLTKRLIDEAEKEYRAKNYENFLYYSKKALANESRIYPEIKNINLDVVQGVIFYLALLLPFSFFMEKLIFSYTQIKKQIIATVSIFLVIYFLLRFVHPAFKLIRGSEIILLGFIILALSIIVLSIVSSRFEEQMGKIKKGKGITSQDVGRITAMGVAFSLGISNMKKYRERTLLTCITIIVITFCILSFTSIKSRLQYTKIAQKGKTPYQGILIRDRRYLPLELSAYEWIKDEFKNKGIVAPRAWNLTPDRRRMTYITIKGKDKEVDLQGILGVVPEEKKLTKIDQCLVEGKWFESDCEDASLISDDVSKLLNLRVGDSIQMFGKRLEVKGIFSSAKLKEVKDLDTEMFTPANMSELSPHEHIEIDRARTTELQLKKTSILFPHLPASNIIIIPFKTLLNLGGNIHSIGIKLDETLYVKIEEIIEDLLSRLALTIYASVKDKIYSYSSVEFTTIGGLSNLFIPILIGSLIILNTMLGSVYERKKDIGIYSSVGLAPTHVATLFIGEASVYALIGAVSGYLIGQALSKILSSLQILQGLTLNYSSLSCVFTTLLAMAVVLFSTIYPARKASQLSVPDVTRSWEIPEPVGDSWNFIFPFTISKFEVSGFFYYLKEFFDSYTEASVGSFYTEGAELGVKEGNYFVSCSMWLAPYDLGTKQRITLEGVMTEEFNLYEIKVVIKRLEGDVTNWKRLNKRFLNILRKEFLVWRTVNIETKEEYSKMAKKAGLGQ